MESMEPGRSFLKATPWERWPTLETDQRKRLPAPPFEKPCPPGATLIALPAPQSLAVGTMPLALAIGQRRSRRQYTADPLSREELSFLLWATQGLRELAPERPAALRTVPSAGGRHPFETYLAILRVEDIAPGLYRYLPLEHQLCFLYADPALAAKVSEACDGQSFVGRGAVVFVWTAVPYRSEWRYSVIAHKMIALDAGHVCQNLYLACEAIGAGTCAIGDYSQGKMDALLGVDGEDEFAIYAAPVGKVAEER